MITRGLRCPPAWLARRMSVAALALALLCGAAAAAPDPSPADAARATMQRVFAAVSVLLPEAARDDGFADPTRQTALREAFATLRSAAAELAQHGSVRDAGFRLLSRSLADDAALASESFESGRAEEARFAFHLMTQRCIDCHSRLPDLEDSALAERLIALPEVAQLDGLERARFDVALRRFDDALALWEARFADPAVPPAQLDLEGSLADYLTVAVRVKGDSARPHRALSALARRADIPAYLRLRLVTWDVSFGRVDGKLAEAPLSLTDARSFAAMARNLSELPTARDGLVYDLAASSLLWRWIETREAQPRVAPDLELAEAYYALAVVEERTAYSYWVPQTDAYMEAALRAAPAGPLARRAYARIEEQLLIDLGATSANDLPEPERARLAELRALIDGASRK